MHGRSDVHAASCSFSWGQRRTGAMAGPYTRLKGTRTRRGTDGNDILSHGRTTMEYNVEKLSLPTGYLDR